MSNYYEVDILNRYPDHTLTSSVINDQVTVELKDKLGALVQRARAMSKDDAIKKIRFVVVGGPEVAPVLTTTQISTVTGMVKGTVVDDETKGGLEAKK